MRRVLAAAALAAAFTSLAPAPANASIYCGDLGPVPGWGPVCLVGCLLGAVDVDVKDLVGTVEGVVTHMCPA